MNVTPDNPGKPAVKSKGNVIFPIFVLPLLFLFCLHSAPAQNQSDQSEKKETYEKTFGNEEDGVQTAAQAAQFAQKVLAQVGESAALSSIRYYAHDRLRSLLSNYDNSPEILQVLIKINQSEQRLKGFSYSRNERLIELLRKKGREIQDSSKQLEILLRIIGEHRKAAQHALQEKDWDKSLSEYNRIIAISNNIDGINQTNSTQKMIDLINRRKKFERVTAELINRATNNPENGSLNRKAGHRLTRLKRWSHALLFLQNAEQSGSSVPLLHAVQIAMSFHFQAQSETETLGKFLIQLENVSKQLQSRELIRACLEIGLDIYREIDKRRKELTSAQEKQINSIFENWKKQLLDIGINPSLSLSEADPKNLFHPRDGLELYAPGNGNARDYSGNNNNGVMRRGVRINLGEGILGAFEFIGLTGPRTNSVTFGPFDSSLYTSSFTVGFWFKRNQFHHKHTPENVANILFSVQSKGYDTVQIGSVGKYMQVYLNSPESQRVIQVNAGIQNDEWYHLALTFQENRSREAYLFLNGSLVNKWSPTKGPLNPEKGRIMFGNTDRSGTPFIGFMDDLFFYSRVLNPEEIKSLYNRILPK